ncbi:hypothetical protein [Clostridium botulinum]|uniref:hypothetical protein n=1 Tax=Clostridium botulinum TaxID=1491 RepID=UPI0019670BDB|nr:hypothetical protein [Clostridium botulinum]
MSKYFVVNDIKVASVMAALLNENYYKYNNGGREVYTFKRTSNISSIYAKAMTIIENL